MVRVSMCLLLILCHAAGNEAPQASVQALFSVTGQDPPNDDDRVSQSLSALLAMDLFPVGRNPAQSRPWAQLSSSIRHSLYPKGI